MFSPWLTPLGLHNLNHASSEIFFLFMIMVYYLLVPSTSERSICDATAPPLQLLTASQVRLAAR